MYSHSRQQSPSTATTLTGTHAFGLGPIIVAVDPLGPESPSARQPARTGSRVVVVLVVLVVARRPLDARRPLCLSFF